MPDLKPDHLIVRYLSREASASEQEQLFEWVSHSKENQKIFNEYSASWSKQEQEHPVFDFRQALRKLNEKIDAQETTEKKKIVFWNRWSIAATLALMMLAGFVLYVTSRDSSETQHEIVLSEFATTTQQDTIRLSDGSVITLNANSSLKYPEAFSAANREVYLRGEAFFEIAKDSSKPFIIHTGSITTQVVGTSFNINTAANNIIVSVATGSVKVSDGSTSELLKPYEKATYTGSRFSKESTNLSELAWNDRSLKFDDTPLEQVIKKLERHYEVKIVLNNKALKKCALTGKFNNEPLDAVLQAMEYSLGVTIKHVNDTITLSGKGCQY
jgi:transmembrane sensor